MCSLVFGAHRVVFFLIFFFLRKKPKTWGHRDIHFVVSGWSARLGLPTSNPGHGIVLVGFCPLLKRSVCWFSELSSNSFVCLLANNKSTCLISFTNERWIYRFTEPFKKLNNLFMVLVCHFLSLPGFFDVKHFSRWIGVFGIATFCCCFFSQVPHIFSISSFCRRGSFLRHHQGCVCSPSLKLNWAMKKKPWLFRVYRGLYYIVMWGVLYNKPLQGSWH